MIRRNEGKAHPASGLQSAGYRLLQALNAARRRVRSANNMQVVAAVAEAKTGCNVSARHCGVINKPAPPTPEAKPSQHLAKHLSNGRNGFENSNLGTVQTAAGGTRVLQSVKVSARHDVQSI